MNFRYLFLFVTIFVGSLLAGCGTSPNGPAAEEEPLPEQLYMFLVGHVGKTDTIIVSDDSLSYVVAAPTILTFRPLLPNRAVITYTDTGTTCIWVARAKEAIASEIPNVCGAVSRHWSSPIRIKVLP